MNAHVWPAWRQWVRRLGARQPNQEDPVAGCEHVDIKDTQLKRSDRRTLYIMVLQHVSNLSPAPLRQFPGPTAVLTDSRAHDSTAAKIVVAALAFGN